MKIIHGASRVSRLPRQLKSSSRRQNVAVDAAVDITSISSIPSRECGNGTERERNKHEKISFRWLADADSNCRATNCSREGRTRISVIKRQAEGTAGSIWMKCKVTLKADAIGIGKISGFAILGTKRRFLQYKRVVQGELLGWQWETRELRIDSGQRTHARARVQAIPAELAASHVERRAKPGPVLNVNNKKLNTAFGEDYGSRRMDEWLTAPAWFVFIFESKWEINRRETFKIKD